MKLEFLWQIVEKYWNMKFHENMSLEAEVLHVDGRMDMTKIIGALRYFVNAPKKIEE